MINGGPDRPLILPPRSNDIFDPNYHPDIEAQEELRFQAYRKSGLGPQIREPKTRADANAIAVKITIGLLVGVPVLSYVIFKLVMRLGY